MPSLPMFLLIPWMMRHGVHFYGALALGCGVAVPLHGPTMWVGGRMGVVL
ncbi:hypothetical protein ACMAUO_11810 [Gluconacetobacter sp. Hr-1-5]